MTFYIEQLFLLPGKLDETERQIIPVDTPGREILFLFSGRNIWIFANLQSGKYAPSPAALPSELC